MWLTPDIDGCVFDTIDCYHSCDGCKYGIVTCSGRGNYIEWDEDICLDCGLKKPEGD